MSQMGEVGDNWRFSMSGSFNLIVSLTFLGGQ